MNLNGDYVNEFSLSVRVDSLNERHARLAIFTSDVAIVNGEKIHTNIRAHSGVLTIGADVLGDFLLRLLPTYIHVGIMATNETLPMPPEVAHLYGLDVSFDGMPIWKLLLPDRDDPLIEEPLNGELDDEEL